MERRWFFTRVIFLMLILLMGIGGHLASPARLSAASIPVTTEVKHKPIKYFVSGHRIALDAKVTDESGVKLVRCYFKADEQAEYVFVPMTMGDGQEYRAILPAPADYAEKIRYIFLVVNVNQQVVKTQSFMVEKADHGTKPPAWQEVGETGDVSVYTEVAQPPETMAGFSDSVTVDAVESSLRFGMVAGIYSASATAAAGSATGAAAAATSAGTISTAAGISTTVILATAAGVAAGVGAIAAAGGGGGGDNGGEEKINPNASISWGDSDSPADDSFQAVLCNETLGTASSVRTRTGLPVGSFDLTIRAVSTAEEFGSFVVNLGGGAYFREDGGIRKGGRLMEGESIVFPILVPDTGSARIEW